MSNEISGVKHDQDKLPWELLPYDAVREVVKVLLFGKKKYSARNWEGGIVYSRLYAAAIRHLTSWFQDGEDQDPETGISHLAHACCCVLFMLAYVVRGTSGVDDRPKPKLGLQDLLDNNRRLVGKTANIVVDVGEGPSTFYGRVEQRLPDGDLSVKTPGGGIYRESIISLEVKD